MLPLIKFRDMLEAFKAQMIEDYDELIGAAHVIGIRPNYLTLDENGQYHVQASGTLAVEGAREHIDTAYYRPCSESNYPSSHRRSV